MNGLIPLDGPTLQRGARDGGKHKGQPGIGGGEGMSTPHRYLRYSFQVRLKSSLSA